ncbi:MAG: tRNA lysidine(34) synthetase TilS [Cyclobacteriaceae bacterium]
MLQKFQTHIAQWCKTTDKILLAVSGGQDSMAMLDLFVQSGFAVAVAHANFQLRGAESDEDEMWLATYCGKKSIPFHSTRFDTNNYAITKGISIQMAARELRYAWFHQLREVLNMDWVATAHHHNDSIETILLNLTKGTSLKGLQGIAPVHGRLLRPLLFATRHELAAYVADRGIPWREDESNESDDYQRNLIRHHVVPRFFELNPSFETSMAKTAEKLAGAQQIVKKAVRDWARMYVHNEGELTYMAKKGIREADADRYADALLWELLQRYGFHHDQCLQIVTALDGQPGKKFVSATHELVVDRADLIIKPLATRFTDVAVTIEKDQTKVFLVGQTMTIQTSTWGASIQRSKTGATLNLGLISFPLIWRKWKAGDWFVPLGMKNRKKISDFLIDEKISVAEKESVTVLESGGDIIWVVGYRIDDRFKVTEPTAQALDLQLVKDDKNQVPNFGDSLFF